MSDPVGGGPVAFQATMLYRPRSEDMGSNHKARLVWMIQALVDVCELPKGAPSWGCEDVWYNFTYNRYWKTMPDPTVIHTYSDDWYLTGFSAREDHGLTVAALFEDPETMTDTTGTYVPDTLLMMARALSYSLLAGRTEADGQRLTLADIEKRFDKDLNKDLNATVSITDHWGFPQGTFQVVTKTLEHLGLYGYVPMTMTKEILTGYFQNLDGSPKVNPPHLLYIKEETARTVELDGTGGIQQRNQQAFTFDGVAKTTIASVNMAPYRQLPSRTWDEYPFDDYWRVMEPKLKAAFQQGWGDTDPEAQKLWEDPQTVGGALLFAQSLLISAKNGIVAVVESDGVASKGHSKPDEILFRDTRTAFSVPGAAVGAKFLTKELVKLIIKFGVKGSTLASHQAAQAVLNKYGAQYVIKNSAGDVVDGGLFPHIKDLVKFRNPVASGLLLAAVIVTIVVVVVLGAMYGFKNVMPYVLDSLNIAFQLYTLYYAYRGLSAATRALGSVTQAIGKLASSIGRAIKIAGAIALIVIVAVTIITFFMTVKADVGSLDWNNAFADMVASIAVAVLLTIISLIPGIGALIAAVIALIDAALAIICRATGWNDPTDKDNYNKFAAKWVCGGISGLLAKAIKWLIYEQNPLVDMENEKRLQPHSLQPTLVDSDKGFAVGNSMILEMGVMTHLFSKSPKFGAGAMPWSSDQFNEDNYRQSAFEYIAGDSRTITPLMDAKPDMREGTMRD
jgi:uncharacterized membrane protein